MASPPWFAGAEIPATIEGAIRGTVVVDSTQHTAPGVASYKCTPTGSSISSKTGLAATTIYARCRVKATAVSTSTGWGDVISCWAAAFASIYASVSLQFVGGVASVGATNSSGAGSGQSGLIGSWIPIDLSTWHRIELKTIVSATVGEIHLLIDGVEVSTGTGLDTLHSGTTIDSLLFGCDNVANATLTSGFVWVDDCCVRTDAYPGDGYVIGRQIAANGNYNAWTYSTGTTLSSVLDKAAAPPATTPVMTDASNNVDKFSGTVDFTTTGGTGSSAFGTGRVQPNDLINGFKISAYGRTSNVTTDGADSTIFRTGGVDTNTALSAWAITAAPGDYKETILVTTPTAAQVRSCEMGMFKGTGTNTHSIYAMWAQVDYIPRPDLPLPARRGRAQRKRKAPIKAKHAPKSSGAIVNMQGTVAAAQLGQFPIAARHRQQPKRIRRPKTDLSRNRRSLLPTPAPLAGGALLNARSQRRRITRIKTKRTARNSVQLRIPSAPTPVRTPATGTRRGQIKRLPKIKAKRSVRNSLELRIPQAPVAVRTPITGTRKEQVKRTARVKAKRSVRSSVELRIPQAPAVMPPLVVLVRHPQHKRTAKVAHRLAYHRVVMIITGQPIQPSLGPEAIVNWRERGGY